MITIQNLDKLAEQSHRPEAKILITYKDADIMNGMALPQNIELTLEEANELAHKLEKFVGTIQRA
jgi:hypothetical protein